MEFRQLTSYTMHIGSENERAMWNLWAHKCIWFLARGFIIYACLRAHLAHFTSLNSSIECGIFWNMRVKTIFFLVWLISCRPKTKSIILVTTNHHHSVRHGMLFSWYIIFDAAAWISDVSLLLVSLKYLNTNQLDMIETEVWTGMLNINWHCLQWRLLQCSHKSR